MFWSVVCCRTASRHRTKDHDNPFRRNLQLHAVNNKKHVRNNQFFKSYQQHRHHRLLATSKAKTVVSATREEVVLTGPLEYAKRWIEREQERFTGAVVVLRLIQFS